jgi:hypothetical protein
LIHWNSSTKTNFFIESNRFTQKPTSAIGAEIDVAPLTVAVSALVSLVEPARAGERFITTKILNSPSYHFEHLMLYLKSMFVLINLVDLFQ